jgi:arylsulfatase A-like enzyme
MDRPEQGALRRGLGQVPRGSLCPPEKLGIIPADAKLTPRPAGLPAWESLNAGEKRLYAHQMEVFSAFLEQTDAEIGRLVKELRQRPGVRTFWS